MIHFFPASNPKLRAKLPDMIGSVDVLLANLEDGVPASDKTEARAGMVETAQSMSSARPSSGRASTASTRRGVSMT